MAQNKDLNQAKAQKNDEFYTQLSDIENEMRHYRSHFKGKTVFCNCDDPYESNFFKYFAIYFNSLGLKKLIATCYRGSPISYTELPLFPELSPEVKEIRPPYKAVITEVADYNNDGAVDLADVEWLLQNKKNSCELLKGDGDFRSDECIELLKEADIVVTNPPFSLFREFVAQLMKYDKKFIIIGSQNAIHYKEIFPLIQQNRLWLGYGFNGGNAYFSIPKSKSRDFAQGVYDSENGLVKFRNCEWFTNLDVAKRHEEMILTKKYVPSDYPRYFNYDAIDVSRIADIPEDYMGEMGVPDTFLEQYNPDQFEIIGIGTDVPKTMVHTVNGDEIQYVKDGKVIWSTSYTVTERKAGNSLRLDDNGKPGKMPFSRVIIRRKQ